MGLFNNLMSKIFGHAETPGTAAASSSGTQSATGSVATATAPATTAPAITAADVEMILDGLAATNPEKWDRKRSMVDLMKLVGMDRSLAARKQLATALH